MMDILRDETISDVKKESVIVHAIIPVVAASCNNRSLDLTIVFSDTFLTTYIQQYLPSLNPKRPTVSKFLLIALLKLNSVLIRYLWQRFGPLRKTIVLFAQDLYDSVDDDVVSYALLFLCQYCNSCEKEEYPRVLLLNIIHLYKNQNKEVIYQASELLRERICRSLV